MHKLIIEISDDTYDRMAKQAKITNKTPVMLVKDLLQVTYGNGVLHSTNGHSPEASRMNGDTNTTPKTTRELLEEAGMVVPLSDELRALAMPEVTIEEVREIMAKTKEPSSCANSDTKAAPKTIQEILEAEGMLEPQDDDFSESAMPAISIETARNILAKAGGPSLTEILDEQRGPKL